MRGGGGEVWSPGAEAEVVQMDTDSGTGASPALAGLVLLLRTEGEEGKFPRGLCWASKHVWSFNPHNSPVGEVLRASFLSQEEMKFRELIGLAEVTQPQRAVPSQDSCPR